MKLARGWVEYQLSKYIFLNGFKEHSSFVFLSPFTLSRILNGLGDYEMRRRIWTGYIARMGFDNGIGVSSQQYLSPIMFFSPLFSSASFFLE